MFFNPNCRLSVSKLEPCSDNTIKSNSFPNQLLIVIAIAVLCPLLFLGIGTNVDNNPPEFTDIIMHCYETTVQQT